MKSAWLVTLPALVVLVGCQHKNSEAPTHKTESPAQTNPQDGMRQTSPSRRTPLESIPTIVLKIKDIEVTTWVADTDEVRTEGLMFVTKDEMPENQGMLFVFPDVDYLGFWMKNTLIPLDIAFLRSDGTIVTIHTMSPLEERTYRSTEPAQYAIEMHAGWFDRHGVKVGDKVDLRALASKAKE